MTSRNSFEHDSERLFHRLLHHRVDPQPLGNLRVNRLSGLGSRRAGLRGENLGGHAMEGSFRQIGPGLRGQLHDFAERRFAAIADDLFAGAGHGQLDLGANLRVERLVRFILGIGGGRILVTRAEGVLDAAANFTQDNPFLADFVIGQEAAGQEGVAAVVEDRSARAEPPPQGTKKTSRARSRCDEG